MNYELMLVIQGQIPEDLAREVLNKVKSIIEEFKSSITLEDFWGRRKLAYKIGSQEHGYYDVLNFSIEPENIKKIENEIKLIGEVIRYLVIKKEEKVVVKKTKKVKVEAEKTKSEKSLEKKKEEEKKEKIEEVGKPEREKKEERKEIKAKEKSKKDELEIKEPVEKEKKKEEKKEIGKEEKERLQELDRKIDEILKE